MIQRSVCCGQLTNYFVRRQFFTLRKRVKNLNLLHLKTYSRVSLFSDVGLTKLSAASRQKLI